MIDDEHDETDRGRWVVNLNIRVCFSFLDISNFV